jgi:hypothetical protein
VSTVPSSMLEDVRPASAGPAPRWASRIGLTVLFAVVLLGAFGVFGVHSRTASHSSNGYTLTITYPQVARAGLDVPWRARVHRDGGVNSDITLAVSSDYFRMFETQGFYPNPDSSTNDGTYVYLRFTNLVQGRDFLLEYDAYIQPGSQIGKSGTVLLLVGGHEVARTSFHTWLVP